MKTDAEILAEVDSNSVHVHDGAAPAEHQSRTKPGPTAEFDAATLDLASLAGRTPPERRFAWKPWIPTGEVTLLHGFGGVGKSLLVQQLATATVLGTSMFGGEVETGTVLVIAGEDSHDELWRRQMDICQRLGCTLDDLARRLHLVAAPHMDITIAETSENCALQPTATFATIKALVERLRPALIILDNSAKLFAVKEGDRVGVTHCVRLLRSLCHEFATTVVLVAHNNKLGDMSGSTAWENASRARLTLTRDGGGETVTFAMPKANYSANGEIKLRYDRGTFRCDDDAGMTAGERIEAEQERRRHAKIFLGALDTMTEQGRAVSHSKRASNYAPKAFVDAKLNDGLTKKQLEAGMELLFDERRIEAGVKVGQRAQRSPQYGIARKGRCEG